MLKSLGLFERCHRWSPWGCVAGERVNLSTPICGTKIQFFSHTSTGRSRRSAPSHPRRGM
jgi:hypothetical protein